MACRDLGGPRRDRARSAGQPSAYFFACLLLTVTANGALKIHPLLHLDLEHLLACLSSRLSKTQYQFTLTDIDQQELKVWSQRMLAVLKGLPQLADVASDQGGGARELTLQVDRDNASRLGLTPAIFDESLYDAFGQRHVAQIFTTLNNYYVILEVDPKFQLGPYALNRIYVRSTSGGQVPLSAVAKSLSTLAPCRAASGRTSACRASTRNGE